jgi:hypothetical protein
MQRTLSSSALGEAEFVRYPFMPEVEKYVKDSGFTISDIADLKAPKAQAIMGRAEERILQSFERKAAQADYEDRFVEIFSYFLALIVVKAVGSAYLERAFSRSEGARARTAFLNEDPSYMCKIINDLFGLQAELVDKLPWRAGPEAQMKLQFRIPAHRYLQVLGETRLLDKPGLSLIENVVHQGYVYLSRDRLVDMVQDQFSMLVLQRIKRMERPVKLPAALQGIVERISARLPKPRAPKDLGQYEYIEKLLQSPMMDGRHRVLWLILPPYLINVKKLSDEEAYEIITKYLERCGWHEARGERLVKYNISRARRIGLRPPRLERLAETNPGLYKAIVEAISKT